MREIDDAETRPVPAALSESAKALTCAVQSRVLLHDAGEWLAGAKFNVPDAPMQRQIEHAAALIHDAEQAVLDITAKLHKRVDVLRDGNARITQR